MIPYHRVQYVMKVLKIPQEHRYRFMKFTPGGTILNYFCFSTYCYIIDFQHVVGIGTEVIRNTFPWFCVGGRFKSLDHIVNNTEDFSFNP